MSTGDKYKKPCEVEGCWQLANKGVYCYKHGGRGYCSGGCEKHPQKGGLCVGGDRAIKPCEVEGCWQLANKGVYCKHGGRGYCSVEGCEKPPEGGLCVEHGGQSYKKPCEVEAAGSSLTRGSTATSTGGRLCVWRGEKHLRKAGCG